MNAETLKDFLISLGFNVDEAGAKTVSYTHLTLPTNSLV